MLEERSTSRQKGSYLSYALEIRPEEFRDALGGTTGRKAPGSKGVDLMAYERNTGNAVLGFDLKTGRSWSALELAEVARRFGVRVVQVKTR